MRMSRALTAALLLTACGSSPPSAPAKPAPPPAPALTDLVSPASASGTAHAHGLDWSPEKRAKKGSEVFKNAVVLADLPAERLMVAMQSMEPNLGVDCGHCHEQGDFSADGKKPKVVARTMLRMAADIDTRFFDGHTEVTCYTCHRRDAVPDFQPQRKPIPWPLPQLDTDVAARPAKEVYKNLQVLGEMPAGRLAEAMEAFSTALGTGCIHCHVEGKWSSDDKPAKKRAREMMGMVGAIGATYFAGEKNPVRCGTCHQGNVRPMRAAGPALLVKATLPGGAPAPRALIVVGPEGFAPANRAAIRAAIRGPDKAKYEGGWIAGGETELEVGHLAPGRYSMCSVTVPADPNPAADPHADDRPVSCKPLAVTAEPDPQTQTLELTPLAQ